MDKIDICFEYHRQDAVTVAWECFETLSSRLDDQFGEDYTKNNPLATALLSLAAALNYSTSMNISCQQDAQELMNYTDTSIHKIAELLDIYGGGFSEIAQAIESLGSKGGNNAE